MAKWAIKLREFKINFQSEPTIKVKALADFLMECTVPNEKPTSMKSNDAKKTSLTRSEDTKKFLHWILHVDRALDIQGCSTELILISLNGVIMEYVL